MNKQIILILTILLFTAFNANAQYWFGAYPKSQNDTINQNRNFYEFQNDFNDYWGDKEITPETPRNERGGWKQFKRWEWFWEQRVYPSGIFPEPDILWKEIQKLKANRGKDEDKLHSFSWEQVGPSTSDGGYAGLGRLNIIAEDPGYNGSSNQIIWVGSASGGLWKTTDAGSSWTTNTDQLSTLGVSAIAIDPDNTNIMYIATGDGDHSDAYSVGVLKSTNGGVTWNTTGLNWTTTQTRIIREMKMHPTNSSILYAATSIGVFKTSNGGTNWSQQSIPLNTNSGYWDIEINPSDPNIVYVSSNYEIARTTNGGTNWSILTSGLPSNSANIYRVEMSLSPANNNHLFAIYGYYNWSGGNSQNNYGLYGIYGTTNGGTSWDEITRWDNDSLNLLGWSYEASDKGGQAFYDLDILADKNSTNTFFVGGVNVWRTTNRGTDWDCVAHWYGGGGNPEVHADHHQLYFGGSNRMYSGHDGGINRTTNGGDSWTWIGSGLKITQFYRFGISQTDPNMLIAGAQDNGTKQMSGTNWRDVIGGDGMECIVNYNNSNYIFGSLYYGRIFRSTNKGNSFSELNTPIAAGNDNGAWVTPYILHPTNPEILYAGYKEIWKSTNNGTSWSKISNFGHNSRHTVLHISESNPSYIYAGYSSTLRRTTNAGSSWSVINLPISNTLTYMAVHPEDPDKIWATFSGYSSDKKVYYSSNGGAGWTNISKNLPNVPVNCVTYQKDYNNRVYVGTDIGIFYIDDTMTDWEEFNDDLPNVIVNEIEINYEYELIYAATFGRGVWKNSLPIDVIGTPTLLLPPNNSSNVPLAQILKWSSVENVDNYQIQISTNSTFTNIVKDSTGIVDTTFSFANYNSQYNTQYYWRVRAKKGSNTGAWTSGFNFTTEPLLLAPTLTSPTNNATSIAINANLQWNAATGATSYDVEIATDANFNNIVKNVNSLVATSYSMINIPADYASQYYWRVRSKSATQTSDWSSTFNFTTEPRLLPPDLTSPSNNATGIAINANMQWNSATGASSYDLEIASDVNFNNIIKNENSLAATSYSMTNIPADYATQYYWRLRSKSATQTSDWSSTFNFTTEPLLLPPVLTSPSNNATGIAINANLQWNSATGASSFDLEIATDVNFNNIIKDVNSLVATSYSLTNIPADYANQYFWRLRSKSATQTSDWSGTFNFTTEPRLLPPVLTSPSNNATGIAINANLQWNSATGASSYDLEIATDANFNNIIKNENSLVATSYSLINVPADYVSQYYWRLRSQSATQTSDWSSIFNFTTEPRLLPPVLTSPSNNATGIAINANLEWNSAIGAIAYDLQVASDAAFNNIVKLANSIFSTNYALTNVPANYATQYYWRLRSKNSSQVSDWSDADNFTTEPRLLPPVMTSPINNATNIAVDANLLWNSATGAASYDLEIATDANFNNIIKNENSLAATSYSLINVPADYVSQYYWRLRSQSATQTSDWSSTFNFTTEPRLLPPVMTSPINNATNTAVDANLLWNSATGASSYDLEIATDANFNNIIKDENSLAATSYSLTNIPADYESRYYWRLRSKSATQTSDWSSAFNFTTEPRLLPPVMTSPINNATNTAVDANLLWNSATGASSYDLEIATDANFNSIIKSEVNLASLSYSMTNIPADYESQYYWRLRSKSATQTSDWSSAFNFTTEPLLLPPVLTSPQNNAIDIAIDANLLWNSATGASSYDLEIATDANFNNIVKSMNSLATTMYSISNIPAADETQYYWRLRSKSATQTSDWSSIFNFTTIMVLNPPDLIYPANNAIGISKIVLLNWSDIPNADEYRIQLADNINFTNPKINMVVTNQSEYQAPNGLLKGNVTYYWRVKALNGDVESEYSTIFNFTTENKVPDSWLFVEDTPTKSKIVVPTSINPQIGGRNIASGDAIGIFFDDAGTQKCAGYAYWTGVILQITVWGDDPLTVEKDGFSTNELYSFKLWDSQIDLVYTAEVTYSSGPNNFQNNATSILASLNSLTDIQVINLNLGWNMISSYIAADMPSMEDIFSDIDDELVICKNGIGNVYLPEFEINDIGNWNIHDGYQVYMNQAETLIISGTAAEPENETINLSLGWHLVSYLRKTAMDISIAMESIEDNLIIAKDNLGNVYLPEFGINTIGDMLPGQGYQIYLSSADDLIYPPNSAGKYNAPNYRYSRRIIPVLPQISGTGNSMTTIVEFDERYNGHLFIATDDKGRLVGSAIIENGICPIVIWQDDERNSNSHSNSTIQYSVIDQSTNLEISGFVITRQTDLLTKLPNDISKYGKNAVNYGKALLPTGIRMIQNIMPIPAVSEFSIEYAVAENSNVRIKLFSISGQEVAVLKDLPMQSGIYTETYSTGIIGSGEYIIMMEQGSEIDTERMIIEK